jgi:hypothetical protein
MTYFEKVALFERTKRIIESKLSFTQKYKMIFEDDWEKYKSLNFDWTDIRDDVTYFNFSFREKTYRENDEECFDDLINFFMQGFRNHMEYEEEIARIDGLIE